MRLVYGPLLTTPSLVRPPVAGELPDVAVEATLGTVTATAGARDQVDIEVVFSMPAYDPATANGPLELHAVAFAAGATLPKLASDALGGPEPKASADSGSHTSGGTLSVVIGGAGVSTSQIATVIGYPDDPEPTDPPATTTATGTTPDPTTAPASGQVGTPAPSPTAAPSATPAPPVDTGSGPVL